MSGSNEVQMSYYKRVALCLCLFLSLCFTQASLSEPSPVQQTASAGVRDFFAMYCVSCHNDRLKTADLLLDKADTDHVSNSAEIWEKVVIKLRSRSMPPAGNRRPDNATYDAIATWLENELD